MDLRRLMHHTTCCRPLQHERYRLKSDLRPSDCPVALLQPDLRQAQKISRSRAAAESRQVAGKLMHCVATPLELVTPCPSPCSTCSKRRSFQQHTQSFEFVDLRRHCCLDLHHVHSYAFTCALSTTASMGNSYLGLMLPVADQHDVPKLALQ